MSHAQCPELGKCPSAAFFDSVLRDFVISQVPLETVTRVRLPRVEGVDYDTLRCDHCGEDGLGEDVIEPYYYCESWTLKSRLLCTVQFRLPTNTQQIYPCTLSRLIWTVSQGTHTEWKQSLELPKV